MTIGPDFGEVLERARTGDQEALATLYRAYAPVVLGYLRGAGVADAEDLTGEIFVTMIRRLPHVTGDEHHFRSWLLAIAHRKVVDGDRRGARRPERLVTARELEPHVAPEASAELVALEHDGAGEVLAAIRRLSPLQRDALLLRVVADLPVRDIARIMAKPESAVKALLRRGTSTLARTNRMPAPAEPVSV